MNRYPVGAPVTVTIPIADFNDQPVTPTGISLRVLDEDGVELVLASVVTFTPGQSEIQYTVSGDLNTLDVGEALSLRMVEINIVTLAGTFIQSSSYMVAAQTQLIVPLNSFQSYNRALVTSANLPKILNWEMYDRADREIALIEAYQRMTRFAYQISSSSWSDQSRLVLNGDCSTIVQDDWREMSEEYFESFPDHFKSALRRAQIVEANDLMALGDPADKRRVGIMSETIGESSMMFRVGKPLELGLSSAALSILKGYVRTRISITRT